MKTFFTFQYLESNIRSAEECANGIYCAHLNINYIVTFDEGDGKVKLSDGTWFILTEKDGENLSEILQLH